MNKREKQRREDRKRVIRIGVSLGTCVVGILVSLIVKGYPNPNVPVTSSLFFFIVWVLLTSICKIQMLVGWAWRLFNVASLVSWVLLVLSLVLDTGNSGTTLGVRFTVVEIVVINLFFFGLVIVDLIDALVLFPEKDRTIVIGGFWDDW